MLLTAGEVVQQVTFWSQYGSFIGVLAGAAVTGGIQIILENIRSGRSNSKAREDALRTLALEYTRTWNETDMAKTNFDLADKRHEWTAESAEKLVREKKEGTAGIANDRISEVRTTLDHRNDLSDKYFSLLQQLTVYQGTAILLLAPNMASAMAAASGWFHLGEDEKRDSNGARTSSKLLADILENCLIDLGHTVD